MLLVNRTFMNMRIIKRNNLNWLAHWVFTVWTFDQTNAKIIIVESWSFSEIYERENAWQFPQILLQYQWMRGWCHREAGKWTMCISVTWAKSAMLLLEIPVMWLSSPTICINTALINKNWVKFAQEGWNELKCSLLCMVWNLVVLVTCFHSVAERVNEATAMTPTPRSM